MNVGLLWQYPLGWLAFAALQPGLTLFKSCNRRSSIFGVSRAVCRYFERYTSHRMAFCDSMVCACGFMLIWTIGTCYTQTVWGRWYVGTHHGDIEVITILLLAHFDSTRSACCLDYIDCIWSFLQLDNSLIIICLFVGLRIRCVCNSTFGCLFV